MDAEFVGQLVDSMEGAVLQLEQAIEKGDVVSANKLRTFIFDLHRQIDGDLYGSDKRKFSPGRRRR